MKIVRHITVVVQLDTAAVHLYAFLRVSRCSLLSNYRSKEMFEFKFVKVNYIDITYSANFTDFDLIKKLIKSITIFHLNNA